MSSWSWRLNGRESKTSFILKILLTLMFSIPLSTKFKAHTLVEFFFLGEMTFIDLKSFVSVISITKIVHCSPVQLVSQERKRLFPLDASFCKFEKRILRKVSLLLMAI